MILGFPSRKQGKEDRVKIGKKANLKTKNWEKPLILNKKEPKKSKCS